MKNPAEKSSIILTILAGAVLLAFPACKLPVGTLPSGSDVVTTALPPENPEVVDIDSGFGTLGETAESHSARFLAGLPGGGGTKLAAARKTDAWREHSAQMDAAFAAAQGRLSSIRAWRGSAIGGGGGTLFYPFSGPDFLYANAFFPRHRTVILCGLEPVGSAPDISGVSAETLPGALAAVRSSIATPLHYSYFITKDMRGDLAGGSFRGVTPILYTFLARTGHRVISVEPITLSGSGQVVARSGAATGTAPGVRIRAASGASGVRTIYYFRTDLSNSTLGSDKRFLAFVRGQSPSASFVKSASYLMHSGSFSIIREHLKSVSPVIVQDPTGVPYRQLAAGGWDIDLHGNYAGTLDMFKGNYQPDLAAAYAQQGARPMGFGVGYKWSPAESSVVIARRRGGEAVASQ